MTDTVRVGQEGMGERERESEREDMQEGVVGGGVWALPAAFRQMSFITVCYSVDMSHGAAFTFIPCSERFSHSITRHMHATCHRPL